MCVGPFAPETPEYSAPPPVADQPSAGPSAQPTRTEADPEQAAARRRERQLVAYATGRESRILTGQQGLTTPATVGQVQAIGQTGRVVA